MMGRESLTMRALIVAPNISMRMGGEAVLPYHYIREMAARGVEIHAATHARVRDEIEASDIAGKAVFHFVEDTWLERSLYLIGEKAPAALRDAVFNALIGFVTSARLGGLTRRLDRAKVFDVVHQPTPVSPMFPSFLTGLRAPLVIGPMNGAIDFPESFKAVYAKGSSGAVKVARFFAEFANRLIRGKREAAQLLVANDRTGAGLPGTIDRDRVSLLVENGVDLSLWKPGPTKPGNEAVFVFVGRLVWWKGVDILIDAFAQTEPSARLLIIGDGPERENLEAQSADRVPDRVSFTGFLPQPEISEKLGAARALVLPSLRECGGAVILEAFACATTAIATRWGGPMDYITPETGILIEPRSRQYFVSELSRAMNELTAAPERARLLGEAARLRAERHFSWSAKADQMLEIYAQPGGTARSSE